MTWIKIWYQSAWSEQVYGPQHQWSRILNSIEHWFSEKTNPSTTKEMVGWRFPDLSRKFMMTSSNGNIFRVTGPLCGEFTGPGEFPIQRPVMRSFDVFFDLRLNKRLSKQPWDWWFETLSWSLWRHCNECRVMDVTWYIHVTLLSL